MTSRATFLSRRWLAFALATFAAASAANAQSHGAAVDSSEQTRLRCGPAAKQGDIALYGTVRDAASGAAIDSVDVIVQWINITFGGKGIKRLLVTDAARSERGGHYTLCTVPAGATIVAWATRRGATTGAVFLGLGRGPKQLDFAIDSLAKRFAFDSAATPGIPYPTRRLPPSGPRGIARFCAMRTASLYRARGQEYSGAATCVRMRTAQSRLIRSPEGRRRSMRSR
jgi:hypothetical protein